jgi:hypothetical protein
MKRASLSTGLALALVLALGCDRNADSKEDEFLAGATIRVVVIMTDDEWDALADTGQDQLAFAAYRVELANLVMSNSGVSHRFQLADAVPLGMTEDEIYDDASCPTRRRGTECVAFWLSRQLEDGGPPAELREDADADLTMIVMTTDQPGQQPGYARGMPQERDTLDIRFRAGGVTEAADPMTFAHEISHLLGAHHDRYERPDADQDQINFGINLPDVHTRDLMAYEGECLDLETTCDRVPWLSNPNVSFHGQALGTADDYNACVAQHYGAMVADYWEMVEDDRQDYLSDITECPYSLSNVVSVGGELCTGEYEVGSNAELSALSRCGTLRGSLTILEGVSSLTSLSELVIVDGTLAIQSSRVTSLAGLESLQSVGWLSIESPVTSLGPLAALERAETLTIDGAAITDLGGLGSLRMVDRLTIERCSSLTSMRGLSSLTGVTEKLEVEDCDALTSLEGLEAVVSLSELYISHCENLERLMSRPWLRALHALYLFGNPALTSLVGLEGLIEIRGRVSISESPLTDLEPLNDLVHAGSLTLSDLTALTNLNGLRNLETVEDEIVLADNPALLSLAGLESLTEAAALELDDLDSILALTGLSGLRRLGSQLTVTNNDQLLTLGGLDSLTEVPTVVVRQNPRLEACDLPGLPSSTELTCELEGEPE